MNKDHKVLTKASGKVCIDLHGLNRVAERMHALEQKYREGLDQPDATRAPEDLFNREERATLAGIDDLWVGPEGDRSAVAVARSFTDQEYPARTSRKTLPKSPYGVLIGAIMPDDGRAPDQSSQVFEIGKGLGSQFAQSGYLWLSVDDVRHDQSPKDLFNFDNLGYFLVTVTLSQ